MSGGPDFLRWYTVTYAVCRMNGVWKDVPFPSEQERYNKQNQRGGRDHQQEYSVPGTEYRVSPIRRMWLLDRSNRSRNNNPSSPQMSRIFSVCVELMAVTER